MTKSAASLKQWKKRTTVPPEVLVDRYRAGLLLMSLVHMGRIQRKDGSNPWILYVDSDSMMANVFLSIDSLVTRVRNSSRLPSMEEHHTSIGGFLAPDDVSSTALGQASLVLTMSDQCSLGYNTHSGALLFRASRLTGFLFDVMAQSPDYPIDTKKYKMGDQAIWDWLFERAFQMNWNRIKPLCNDMSVFEEPCYGNRILLKRRFSGTGQGDTHPLITKAEAKWDPMSVSDLEFVAFVCVKWMNSPGCPERWKENSPFKYTCGDMVWHLYGCKKDTWKGGRLKSMLNSKECRGILPRLLHVNSTVVLKSS